MKKTHRILETTCRPAEVAAPAPAISAITDLPLGEFAALVGLDWGDAEHAIALAVRGAARAEELTLPHSAESLHTWLRALHARFGGQPVAVAVEASKGAIVAALLEHQAWLTVYPVHPATSRRMSLAFSPSGAKDDRPDARTLLEILQHYRGKLRALLPHDEATRKLTHLVEARRKLVDRRTQLSNELTSLLKNYYPQALELTGDNRSAPLALDFVERWPELALLQAARPKTVRDFYHAHRVRRPELIAARLALIEGAQPLTTDRALCEVSILELRALVAELRLLEKHRARLEEEIATAFAAHPEAAIFQSLPGAGAAMAPRLSVLFGTDRARWLDPCELQTYFGIAPVIERAADTKPSTGAGTRPGSPGKPSWNGPGSARNTARGPRPTTSSKRSGKKAMGPSCAASLSNGCASSGAAGRTANRTTKRAPWPNSSSATRRSVRASPRPEIYQKTEENHCAERLRCWLPAFGPPGRGRGCATLTAGAYSHWISSR
ncbi:MAG TPA: transposase [Chthoniobacteraceae bacterium]|nr:transposase [Chthoniobacteraceae bacterium]